MSGNAFSGDLETSNFKIFSGKRNQGALAWKRGRGEGDEGKGGGKGDGRAKKGRGKKREGRDGKGEEYPTKFKSCAFYSL